MNDILGIVALVVLVLLNGYFVASEFALVSVRRTRIEQLVNEGMTSARVVQQALKNLDLYIAATQLGITMASLAIGFVAEPAIEHLLHPLLSGYGLTDRQTTAISFAVAFGVSTVLHIVFGELAPKTIALQLPEQTSLAVAQPLIVFTTIFKPAIIFLNWLGNNVVKALGLKPTGHHMLYSEEEIRMIVGSSSQAGLFEEQEREILENIFEFDETTVKAIMTHRTEINTLPANANLRTLIDFRREHAYSRLPIYQDDLDNIVGIVHTADALLYADKLDIMTLAEIKRPAYFVPESMKVKTLFNAIKQQKSHMAIVVDEFGGTAGLVTLEDAIEELVGDIYDETDEEDQSIINIKENEYLVDADVHMDEIETLLNTEIDNKEDSDFETVAGFIFARLGQIPAVGEVVKANGWIFEVMEANERSIQKVRLYPAKSLAEDVHIDI